MSEPPAIPSNCVQIEVHVTELKQLFNAMDPSPFRERDLDPNAEQFIIGWARQKVVLTCPQSLYQVPMTDELLDREQFQTLKEARVLVEDCHESIGCFFFARRRSPSLRSLRSLRLDHHEDHHPDKTFLGLSKLVRIAGYFARSVQNQVMKVNVMHGVFQTNPDVRREFLLRLDRR